MNNNKIIFGIIVFCAISFLAFTFANPREDEDDFIKDNDVNGSKVNKVEDKKDNDIKVPVKVDEVKKEDNKTQTTTPTTPNRPYVPTPTPEPELVVEPKYSTITTNPSTVNVTLLSKTNIELTGTVDENVDENGNGAGQGSVQLVFISPEVYSEEVLSNLEIKIERQGYGVILKHRGDLPDMFTGNGTDNARITINYAVARPSVAYITIDWGTGEKITYTISDNIEIKLAPLPVVPEPEPEPVDPTPDTPDVTE